MSVLIRWLKQIQVCKTLSYATKSNWKSCSWCEEVADTFIIKEVLEVDVAKQPVAVLADDTDIFVMVIHHFEHSMDDIYFSSDKVGTVYKNKTSLRIYLLI